MDLVYVQAIDSQLTPTTSRLEVSEASAIHALDAHVSLKLPGNPKGAC